VFFVGGTLYVADKNALKGTLVDNLKSIRPTIFCGVPRVWEKMRDKMTEAESKASPFKRAIMRWAKCAASKYHNQVMAGQIPLGVEHGSLSFRLAHKLVLSKVHAALGLDRTIPRHSSLISGAAPLSSSTKRYFASLGLFICEMYAATECTGPQNAILESPHGNRYETVGKPIYGEQTKILNPDPITGEGEIAVFSRKLFMGYIKEEDKTRDTFTEDNMWKSGDLGIIDADGFLRVTGRIKELIITEGGKNIAPVPIEDNIKTSLKDVISQVVVVGDNRKHLSCLLTLQVTVDPVTNLPTSNLDSAATSWCQNMIGSKTDSPVCTVDDFMNGPHSVKLINEIQKAINHCNKMAESKVHQVKKFCLLPCEFSFQGGELGPTLKLKRHVIMSKYESFIDQMYK